MKHFALLLVFFASSIQAQSAPSPPRAAELSAVPGPALADAMKALVAANSFAAKAGIAVTCAVLDARGDLLALTRMDGTKFFTPVVAQGKAFAALMFGQPSGAIGERAAGPFFESLNGSFQHRIFASQGGLPVLREQKIIGAIGCSGATGQLDEAAANAGLATLL